jgi:hypothetical protein
LFKLVERGHPQLPVNLQDLVRAQTRDAQHRQDTFWDVLAHGLERRVRSGAVELLDNVSDGFAYARNLTEAILRYDLRKRECECEEAFGGAGEPQRSLTQWIKSPHCPEEEKKRHVLKCSDLGSRRAHPPKS